MKVGILTLHYDSNYGSVYQAYGLQSALRELGHEPVVINYVPDFMRTRISPFRGWGLRSGRNMSDKFRQRLDEAKRRKRFAKFRQKKLNISPRLKTKKDLLDYSETLDAIVVGSDQVWNLNWHKEFDDTYFLGWLDDSHNKIIKIAYGPCFGTKKQPSHHLDKALKLIPRFDHIGLRNTIGSDFLNTATSEVVDPAFFLPRQPHRTPKEHVFLYYVDGAVVKQSVALAKKIARRKKHSVYHVQSESNIRLKSSKISSVPAASPEDWHRLLTEASFVCSESFHGAVFALANNIPFITISSQMRSERILYLLERYNLQNRFIEPDNAKGLDPNQLPFEPDTLKLRQDITNSMNFLSHALA